MSSPKNKCSHIIKNESSSSPPRSSPPRRCKRDAEPGSKWCWQHEQPISPTSKKSPKRSPKKAKKLPKKVTWATHKSIKSISPTGIKGDIYGSSKITDLQGICISSVLKSYKIWDKEDYENAKGRLTLEERRLVSSCLKIMDSSDIVPPKPIKKEIMKFAEREEENINIHRRMVIERESGY